MPAECLLEDHQNDKGGLMKSIQDIFRVYVPASLEKFEDKKCQVNTKK
jgi:hypothetical protein